MGLRTRFGLVTIGCIVLGGCGPEGHPLIEAHRAAAGYWPENSRTAVLGSLGAGFDGLELDLGLTADDVPVLSHAPWLDVDRCTLADGSPLPERLVIAEHTLEELQALLCGGHPVRAHDNAEVVAEPIMSLDELLVALKTADPRTVVHLDLKVGPNTHPAERFATAVLDRWFAADLPNPWYVSAGLGETLRAFEDEGRLRGLEVPTSLIYPFQPAGASVASVAWSTELRGALGLHDYVGHIEEAGADGISVHWEMVDRQQVYVARAEGYTVGLWTLNDADHLRTYARWPVDYLITDYPGDAP